MPETNSKDGSSGRLLVISMLAGATILAVIAAIYTHFHPPINPMLQPTTTQGVE